MEISAMKICAVKKCWQRFDQQGKLLNPFWVILACLATHFLLGDNLIFEEFCCICPLSAKRQPWVAVGAIRAASAAAAAGVHAGRL